MSLLIAAIMWLEPPNLNHVSICIDDYGYLLFESFGIIKLDGQGNKVPCPF